MFAGLLELLFPRGCCACGARPAAAPFCGDCACRLEVPPAWRCPCCGGPIPLPESMRGLGPGEKKPPAPCADCLLPPLLPMRAAFVHGGALAEAIHRLKYRGRRDIARSLAPLIATALLFDRGLVDLVAPIPLHPARRRARGYDQAALLAAAVARCLELPCERALLRRLRPTAQQVGLDRVERLRNLEGAFGATSLAAGRRILLVDDVITTGATARAAAAALFAAGARTVRVAALARAGL